MSVLKISLIFKIKAKTKEIFKMIIKLEKILKFLKVEDAVEFKEKIVVL